MNPTRTALISAVTLALVVTPPVLLSRQEWAVGDEVSGAYLWLSLTSATLPPSVVHALVLVALWALWGAFTVLVAADVIAMLRGQIPRIGLLRLAAVGFAGTSVAVAAPTTVTAVAAPAPADTTLTVGEQSADNKEPAHTLERTRTLPGFAFDSADLTPVMKDELLPTVELLQLFGDPGTPIAVTGHTDTTGPDDYNRDLSQRRAEAVATFLTGQLGESWTITTEGLGADQPREHPDLGTVGDRRAEITYTVSTRPAASEDSATDSSEDSASATTDPEPTADAPAAGFSASSLLTGVAAGGVAGAVAGRLTAPGRRRPQEEAPEEGVHPDPDEGDHTRVDAPMGNAVSVTRDTGGTVIDDQGNVRIADNLSVSARDGLTLVGTHAIGACASLIARALADQGTRIVTTRQVMAAAGAPPRARHAGMIASADTAAAITEAELANITAAHAENGPARILLIVEAPEHALIADRLRTLTHADQDNDVLVLLIGEGITTPVVRCEAFDRIDVTATDGTTATYTDLRLLHLDEATFAAHFAPVEEPPDETEVVSPGPEPAPDPKATDPTPAAEEHRTKVSVQLFAPHPHITVTGEDIGTGMRSSTRRLIAYLALHPHGVGTDALTDALFPDSTESKARALRNTASSDARRVIRHALGDDTAEILSANSGRYQIRQDLVDVDVWRFDAALNAVSTARDPDERLTHLRAAALEYSHELLSEVDSTWIEEKRQAYRRAAADCFVSLAKSTDRPEQALGWLEQARECDDLNEAVYQEIMKTHATLGRSDAVQRTYQDLADRLKPMRARPSSATNRLLNSLSTVD